MRITNLKSKMSRYCVLPKVLFNFIKFLLVLPAYNKVIRCVIIPSHITITKSSTKVGTFKTMNYIDNVKCIRGIR